MNLNEVEHHYADSNGVNIHYVALGEGSLLLFIHGFPDFWYGWRHQLSALQDSFRVVALDCRGYNLSDKPEAQAAYDISLLIEDVTAVIQAESQDKAIIVGHDWGGFIAWFYAATLPQRVDKLIIMNLPHPKGFSRELTHNEVQKANSEYARRFQQPNSHLDLNAERLAGNYNEDKETQTKYVEAFKNSSFNSMMNYYRQNFPLLYSEENFAQMANIAAPVLQFHGLKDSALQHQGLNNTWQWVDKNYSLVTIPDAGHWPHHDAPLLVNDTIRWWLKVQKLR